MAVTAAPGGDRAALWLPLLRRLTELSQTYVVWKQIDSALEGLGDIDSAADPADWDALEQAFREWAAENAVEPVAVCNHIPGGRNLIAAPASMTSFLELSIKHDKIWRGSMLFTLGQLAPLTMVDPRGFRRVRPGAEGLLKLVLNGSRWGGRADAGGLRSKHVVELLDADPDGADAAAELFGPAAPAARTLAARVRAGGWDRRAMLTLEARALGRAAMAPGTLARRAWFRAFSTQTCPVVKAIVGGGRRMPGDRGEWWRSVARTHAVYGLPETSPSRSLNDQGRHSSRDRSENERGAGARDGG
jgi:hypothetical protein